MMRKFKDRLGQEWQLELDLGMRDHVLAVTKIDILEAKEDDDGGAHLFTRANAVTVGLAMLSDQMRERGLDVPAMLKLLNGPAADEFVQAVWWEFNDFFLSTAKYRAAGIQKMIEAVLAGDVAAAERIRAVPAERVIRGTLARVEQAIEGALNAVESGSVS